MHLRFTAVLNSPVPPAGSDDEMSVVFSSTIFGDTFGKDALAITLLSFRGTTMEETDTLFNTVFTWDSYRGSLRAGIQDFHRVAMHEFGHTLGLDHPDEHGQHEREHFSDQRFRHWLQRQRFHAAVNFGGRTKYHLRRAL